MCSGLLLLEVDCHTCSSSQCFEVPIALSLLLTLSFYRINVEPIDLVKSNLS